MLRVCVATTVHYAFDTRVYFKQVLSLSKEYMVDYYAQPSSASAPEPSGKYIPLSIAKCKAGRIKTIISLLCNLWHSKYDVYHFHDPELILLGILLKIKGKAVIIDIHEDVSKQIKDKEWIPALFKGILSFSFSKMERLLPKIFDYVILAEDAYKKHYGEAQNLEVIHNYPFKQTLCKTNYHFKVFKMVYVGDVRRVRGIMEYLKIVKLAKENDLKIMLVVIGRFADKESEDDSRAYIKKYNLEKDVKFYGRIPNNEVYKILMDCDLGLSLLHPIGNYIFSYPTKVFEYMSVGLPVLASNFDLWKDIIENNECGVTVDPLNVHGVFNAVKQYYSNKNVRQERGMNGHSLVTERLNWDNEYIKLKKIYNQFERD